MDPPTKRARVQAERGHVVQLIGLLKRLCQQHQREAGVLPNQSAESVELVLEGWTPLQVEEHKSREDDPGLVPRLLALRNTDLAAEMKKVWPANIRCLVIAQQDLASLYGLGQNWPDRVALSVGTGQGGLCLQKLQTPGEAAPLVADLINSLQLQDYFQKQGLAPEIYGCLNIKEESSAPSNGNGRAMDSAQHHWIAMAFTAGRVAHEETDLLAYAAAALPAVGIQRFTAFVDKLLKVLAAMKTMLANWAPADTLFCNTSNSLVLGRVRPRYFRQIGGRGSAVPSAAGYPQAVNLANLLSLAARSLGLLPSTYFDVLWTKLEGSLGSAGQFPTITNTLNLRVVAEWWSQELRDAQGRGGCCLLGAADNLSQTALKQPRHFRVDMSGHGFARGKAFVEEPANPGGGLRFRRAGEIAERLSARTWNADELVAEVGVFLTALVLVGRRWAATTAKLKDVESKLARRMTACERLQQRMCALHITPIKQSPLKLMHTIYLSFDKAPRKGTGKHTTTEGKYNKQTLALAESGKNAKSKSDAWWAGLSQRQGPRLKVLKQEQKKWHDNLNEMCRLASVLVQQVKTGETRIYKPLYDHFLGWSSKWKAWLNSQEAEDHVPELKLFMYQEEIAELRWEREKAQELVDEYWGGPQQLQAPTLLRLQQELQTAKTHKQQLERQQKPQEPIARRLQDREARIVELERRLLAQEALTVRLGQQLQAEQTQIQRLEKQLQATQAGRQRPLQEGRQQGGLDALAKAAELWPK